MSWHSRDFLKTFRGPIRTFMSKVVGDQTFEVGEATVELTDLEEKNAIFFVTAFSMLAKLAKSDAYVSSDELKAIDGVMKGRLHFSEPARELAHRIFNGAQAEGIGFETFAQEFYDAFRDSPEMLRSMVEILLMVSHSDDDFDESESTLIEQAVNMWGLQDQYENIKRLFESHPDIDRCFLVLGCHISDSLEYIETRYRDVRKLYEDKVIVDDGFPYEFSFYVQDKLIELDDSYRQIVEYHETGS